MKKDFLFTPILLLAAASLFLLDFTGLPIHIAVSVLGILVLAVYTSLTKKEWKIPALEILMRFSYGIALITGIVIVNVKDIKAVVIAHNVFAALFVGLLVILFIFKLISKNK